MWLLWFCDFFVFVSFEWFVVVFIYLFGNVDWMIMVFVVNSVCIGFIVLFKVYVIKLLVFIDDVGLVINVYYRNDVILFIRKGVNFFCLWIKVVLVGND